MAAARNGRLGNVVKLLEYKAALDKQDCVCNNLQYIYNYSTRRALRESFSFSFMQTHNV